MNSIYILMLIIIIIFAAVIIALSTGLLLDKKLKLGFKMAVIVLLTLALSTIEVMVLSFFVYVIVGIELIHGTVNSCHYNAILSFSNAQQFHEDLWI